MDSLESSTSIVNYGTAKHNGGLCQYSPCGTFIATGLNNRLTIRQTESFEIVQSYSCLESIEQIQWSPDSKLILCGIFKQGLVQVWAIGHPDWSCRVSEGIAGLVHAEWSPDSRHILTFADFQLHLTVWSLVDRSQIAIKGPKLTSNGISFSPDKKFLAVAHRADCKDYIGIYFCKDWSRVQFFQVDSLDLEEISWSPSGGQIAIRDCPLEYNLLVYNVSGKLLSRYQAYENALGIKSLQWSPNGEFLAIGSYDHSIRMLNSLTLKPCAECKHDPILTQTTTQNYYQEVLSGDDALIDQAKLVSKFSSVKLDQGSESEKPKAYLRKSKLGENVPNNRQSKSLRPPVIEDTIMQKMDLSKPISLTVIKPDPTKASPRVGVGLMTWSLNAEYIASRNDDTPHTVWIWSVTSVSPVAVVEFRGRVLSLKWSHNEQKLAIVTGNSKLYFWTPENGPSFYNLVSSDHVKNALPVSWECKGLRWPSKGNSILLLSKTHVSKVQEENA